MIEYIAIIRNPELTWKLSIKLSKKKNVASISQDILLHEIPFH